MMNLFSRFWEPSPSNQPQATEGYAQTIPGNSNGTTEQSLQEFMDQPLSSKDWLAFIKKVLIYLKETQPPAESRLFLTERAVLPNEFTAKQSQLFCYAYKGEFLPSGSRDGRVWKPSQGAKPAGNGLIKRYFYYREPNVKIKRQVIWLKEDEEWCWLDYRFNFKGKIRMSQLMFPPDFDFKQLVWRVEAGDIPLSIHPSPHSESKDQETSPNGHVNMNGNPPITPSSPPRSPLWSFPFMSNSDPPKAYHGDVTSAPGSPFIPNTVDEKWMGGASSNSPPNSPSNMLNDLDSLELPHVTAAADSMLEYSPPASPRNVIDYSEVKEEPASKRRKLEEISSSDSQNGSGAISGSSSFFFTGVDFLLTHLLSYDQVVDTITHSICTQLIFNRRFFYARGIDSYALLQQVKQNCCASVDIREFPGKILSNFFDWLRKSGARMSLDECCPQFYCLVCGSGEKEEHNPNVHEDFFKNIDGTLLQYLRDKNKVTNMYEFVSAIISYLLKYPNSRTNFKNFISLNIHCPFCAGTKGVHDHKQHEMWKKLWKIDMKPPKEPEPQEDIQKYTKNTFDYLMDQVPFHIPSFLLNLNNVRSFLECLVSLWKNIRLVQQATPSNTITTSTSVSTGPINSNEN